ncbi:Monocarboxylate transporter 14 [Holothuria leucospilota]|uniref:Monocarboxylate transporter 14 n=1 Tax=Holothuria leucospilota TaxID=206669 RepID=A0A9Q1HEP4_HOLLE|nr:Monocarboxylate transporter 14 [Holothuria leucospilota]
MATTECLRKNWKYILATAAFFQLGGILSPINSFGRLFTGIQSDLNTTTTETGWIGSLAWAMSFVAGPLATVVESYIGYRLTSVLGSVSSSASYLIASFMTSYLGVLIFLGFLCGLSNSLIIHSVLCAIFKSFSPRYQSKATGFALTGISLATILVSLAYEKLVLVFGWRFTLQMSSAFAFVVAVPASFLINPQIDQTLEQQPDVPGDRREESCKGENIVVSSFSDRVDDVTINASQDKDKSESSLVKFLKIFRAWRTWLILFAILFPMMSWSVYWVNVISYFESINIPESDIVIYVAIMTSFDLAGRLFVAIFMERLPKDTIMLIASHLVFVFVTLVFVLWSIKPVLVVCSAFIGVGRAWYSIFPTKAAVDLLGSEDSDQGITLSMLAFGMGFAVGTLPAGAIFDATSSYTLAFILNSVLYLVGASLLIVLQMKGRTSKSEAAEKCPEEVSYENRIDVET